MVQKLNNEELEGRVINPLHAENDAQKSVRIGMGQVVQVYANIWIMEIRSESLVETKAEQRSMKWAGTAGSSLQSLQVGSFTAAAAYLRLLNRLPSASSPSQPTRRRIRKLFKRISLGSPRVTDQCGVGFPKHKRQSERGRWSHTSRNEEYSAVSVRFFTHLFHADLLHSPLMMAGREGRSRESTKDLKSGRDPFCGCALNA